MNFARIYVRQATDDEHTSTQAEVARSEPNAFPATAEYAVPPEYEVTKVELVCGHGNTDLILHVIEHPEMFKEHVAEITNTKYIEKVPDAEA